jgi:hypothetical protein
MADNTENPVLEILWQLRGDISCLRNEKCYDMLRKSFDRRSKKRLLGMCLTFPISALPYGG